MQMSEEIENASVNVPRAMVLTLVLNGAAGYAMGLALLFCMGDIQSILDTKTGFPFVQAFANATGIGGATIMTSIVIVLTWCAVIGFLATASRMVWSFARDKALPFHRYISHVSPWSSVPFVAVLVVTVIPCLLSLIYIGSPVAFEDVVSMSVSGLYASYFVPIACLLWRRLQGHIQPFDPLEFKDRHASSKLPGSRPYSVDGSDVSHDDVLDLKLMWGPWKVPGLVGTVNNAFAAIYCVFVLFWDFWPPEYNPEPAMMNYAVLVTGSVIIFSVVYYVIWGRHEYLGPLVDRDVRRQRPKMATGTPKSSYRT